MVNVIKYWCPGCKKNIFFARAELPSASGDCSSKIKNGYMVFSHQEKERKFIEAIDGHYVRMDCARRYDGLKFVLTDTDILGRRSKLAEMQRLGVRNFFVYPHAARPDLVNDIYQEWAHVTAHFVVSKGHADVMRAFGYSRPLVPVGWVLCPIKKFKPRPDAHRVLFAPIHPRCSAVDQQVNQVTFGRLEKLARAGDIHLTVRFIRSLEASGLQKISHPNIEYVAGIMNGDYKFLDEPDVVVGHQTVAFKSVARGTPTVMMAEDMPTHIQIRGRPVQYAKNWKRYEHLLRYPFDILDADDPLAMLRQAAACDEAIADWRQRMIGAPFRRDRFLKKLQEFL